MSCERSAEDCGGFCGDGTVCQAGKCVVAAVKAEAEVEVEAEEPRGKKKRRRKGGKDGAADEGGGAGLPDRDGHIPRYRADRDEAIGESALGDTAQFAYRSTRLSRDVVQYGTPGTRLSSDRVQNAPRGTRLSRDVVRDGTPGYSAEY